MSVGTPLERQQLLQGSELGRWIKRRVLRTLHPLVRVAFSVLLLPASGAHAWPDQSGGQRLPPSSGLANPVAVVEQQDAQSYYVSEVDAGVQQECLLCHKANGTAEQNGARLVFSTSAVGNHGAFSEFLSLENVGGD